MKKKEKKLYKDSIEMFGLKPQIDMAIEEMGELIVAINHYRRDKINLSPVVEEMVDVDITLNQLKVIFDCEAEFEAIRIKKLERVQKKIDLKDNNIPFENEIKNI